MEICKLKNNIASTAYNTIYTSKLHFATHDIVTNLPVLFSLITFIGGILLLVWPDNMNIWSILFIILGAIPLFMTSLIENRSKYLESAKKTNEYYKELHLLYDSITEKNINKTIEKMAEIDKKLDSVSYLNHIWIISDIWAHFQIFRVCRTRSKWFVNELKLTFWKDMIPESLKSLFFWTGIILLSVVIVHACITFGGCLLEFIKGVCNG